MSTLLWTFPTIMFASVVIGWAAELMALRLSAGIALAVLAWLQTSPEFAVEATIAWQQNAHLALANLTGSLRLLMGLGWPMIFFIHWIMQRRRGHRTTQVALQPAFAVEAAGLAIPVVYFLVVWAKESWSATDGVILCGFYALYFWMLNRERKVGVGSVPHEIDAGSNHEDDAEPWVVRKVVHLSTGWQYFAMLCMFVMGGTALLFTVHPFVESLKVASATIGVSDFVFIQWVAPIASEFPEKITAFNWARRASKVPMAVVNMLSSVTSQWTLLAGLVPLVFSLSAGRWISIELTDFQRTELLLTIAQSAVAVAFLADLKVKNYEAAGLFVLWLAQFLLPNTREPLVIVYFAWFAFEMLRLLLNPSQLVAWKTLKKLFLRR